MSHTVTISIEGCHNLFQLKGELEELQADSQDDEEHLQPFINTLSGILIQAAADGFIPRDGDLTGSRLNTAQKIKALVDEGVCGSKDDAVVMLLDLGEVNEMDENPDVQAFIERRES